MAIANARGISRAQVALAWLMQRAVVSSPIVGATKPRHLDDAVAAVDVALAAEEVAQLELNYAPHAMEGFA